MPHAIEIPDRIPKERYFDPEFFELEAEQLWPRVWQMACRLEEIPEPATSPSTRSSTSRSWWCAPRSRHRELGVTAFQNACRHRGVRVVQGHGTCEGGFTCPFHGWCYGPDGTNTGVPRRKTFSEHNLRARRPRPHAGALRDLGRVRLDQPRPRRAPAARVPRAVRHQPRRLEGRVPADRVVVRLPPAGQLEAGHRGVRRGVPRPPDPPAADHPDALRPAHRRSVRCRRLRRLRHPLPARDERGHGRHGPRQRRARRRGPA